MVGTGGRTLFLGAAAAQCFDGLEIKSFLDRAEKRRALCAGEICYAADPSRRKPNHEMRISFGSASEADIREGIKRLGKVLRKLI